MSAFDIALAIHNDHDPEQEELQAFLLRKFAKEKTSAIADAMDLLMGWERAFDDFESLVSILEPVARKAGQLPMAGLIERKRALGYDAKLEALLARRWRCPHCKQFSNLATVEVPVGDSSRLLRCVVCKEQGVAPIDGAPQIAVHDGGKSGLRPISAGK